MSAEAIPVSYDPAKQGLSFEEITSIDAHLLDWRATPETSQEAEVRKARQRRGAVVLEIVEGDDYTPQSADGDVPLN